MAQHGGSTLDDLHKPPKRVMALVPARRLVYADSELAAAANWGPLCPTLGSGKGRPSRIDGLLVDTNGDGCIRASPWRTRSLIKGEACMGTRCTWWPYRRRNSAGSGFDAATYLRLTWRQAPCMRPSISGRFDEAVQFGPRAGRTHPSATSKPPPS